ncbi:SDR family NAD(P)-dependent oxidoreductase [Halorussus salinisoli]|uniref:SDR family NAD(P)-dependent oxidoreductase n=1 Tax=Halorussus salinisoli TaxID=2558242 RepID=UPI0010C24239|nr:glucose 1-dehydrogenase [Halorussus salinisoli]
MDFDGKTALVTGGASGIGKTTARRFAKKGANVVVVDTDESGGRDTVRAIENDEGEATFAAADVSDEDEVFGAIDQAYETYGSLEVLHNNAGIESTPGPLIEQDTEDFERVLSVNLLGVFFGLKHAIPRMIEDGGGAVVNTASIAGIAGAPTIGTYGATKHGVVGLTRTAAVEYAPEGIRVNAVCPGFTNTPMLQRYVEMSADDEIVDSDMADDVGIDLENIQQLQLKGRVARPEEIADAVVWLASEEASYVNGVAFPIDGGMDAM